jgi:RNA polymerase sigma factor (sigma-70 family)
MTHSSRLQHLKGVAPSSLDMEPSEVAERALKVARPVALGVLGDRDAAADVAQEVAIVAVAEVARLRDPEALDGWLRRIAVRRALDRARRNRRRREAELAHQNGRPAAEEADALDGALALLAGLPPAQRAALTLRYVHDLTDEDIARALGCRPGTVRSLLSRGRAAVRAREELHSCR